MIARVVSVAILAAVARVDSVSALVRERVKTPFTIDASKPPPTAVRIAMTTVVSVRFIELPRSESECAGHLHAEL
jgi:hypothetical protein